MTTDSPKVGDSKATFPAYGEAKKQAAGQVSYSFKVALVAMDCFFLGLQPVLVHLSKNKQGTYSFHPVSVNFMVEAAKTIFALITLFIFGTGRPGPPMYRSLRAFIVDARHNWILAIPAGLYGINNYLKFTMQLFFRPTTTKMIGNLKMFTIALLMRSLLGRRFNVIQWEALFLLVAGITVNQLQNCSTKPSSDGPIPLIPAVLCTLGTITVPAAASVYNELGMKKHMETSVHLQNFFLYFYGACFNFMFLLCTCWHKHTTLAEMFAGQSMVTLLLIANNAAQGILSSFFYKFADTILKKYSSTVATIFTAIMSFAIFGHELTMNFFIGVSIVFISMHQFFTFGDKTGKAAHVSKMVYSPSLEQISIATNGDGSTIISPRDDDLHRRPLLPR